MTSESSPAPTVRTSASGAICTISLSRPDRHNAIDDELFDGLVAALIWAAESADVRVLILRGEGRSFCSGIDIAGMGRRGLGESNFDRARSTQRVTALLQDIPKPSIVALKGAVLGKGLEIALAADFRFVARGATLGFPEVHFGLGPDNGGTAMTAALAGPARTKYLLMTGARIDAERALDWGLADWLVDPDHLDEAVAELACDLAQRAPLAMAAVKDIVGGICAPSIRTGMLVERYTQLALYGSSDHAEAKQARRDGRAPRFTGK